MSTALRTYYQGATLVGMRDEVAQKTSYYHFDHQGTTGTTQCLTDETGAVTDRFACDACGVPVKRTGNSINRHWYIGNGGHYRHSQPLTDYAKARWLANTLGSWTSVDFIRSQGPYRYVINRPASLVDPSGLFWCEVNVTSPVEDFAHCKEPNTGYPAFPQVDVLLSHVFRAYADIRCYVDKDYDRPCKCPDPPDYHFCQAYVGSWVRRARTPKPDYRLILAPWDWCPDTRANRNKLGNPVLNTWNCDRTNWKYEGEPQEGPTFVRSFTQGRLLVCLYKMCMSDIPGERVVGSFNTCYKETPLNNIYYSRLSALVMPIDIDMAFSTWVCDNPSTGHVAPRAAKLHWNFYAKDGGIPQRQSCR